MTKEKTPSKQSINVYYRWIYFEEISNALSFQSKLLAERLALPERAIKVLRVLCYLDEFTVAILKSFFNPNHPHYIDKTTRKDWISTVVENLLNWHRVLHEYLNITLGNTSRSSSSTKLPISKVDINLFSSCLPQELYSDDFVDEYNWLRRLLIVLTERHRYLLKEHSASLDLSWLELKRQLIDESLVPSITSDIALHPIKAEFAHIEPFFRAVHQMIEMVINPILFEVKEITNIFQHLKITKFASKVPEFSHIIAPEEKQKIDRARLLLLALKRLMDQAASHIMILTVMDTASYAEYRQALLGASGGGSGQLINLSYRVTTLHQKLPDIVSSQNHCIAAMKGASGDQLLNQILMAIRLLQGSTVDYWTRHFSLAAQTIGLVRGSQGLPVERLLYFAVQPLKRNKSLFTAIGNLGAHYSKKPRGTRVSIGGHTKVLGDSILPHVASGEYKVIDDSSATTIRDKPSYYLDPIELPPIEPADSLKSPYEKWFKSPDVLRFQMHAFGTPLRLYERSTKCTAMRLAEKQNDYWTFFFTTILPLFRQVLFKVLSIDEPLYTVTPGANVTELLNRLLSALDVDDDAVILCTNQDFLTGIRSFSAFKSQSNASLEKLSLAPNNISLHKPFIERIANLGEKLKLLFFTPVMSNSQMSMTEDEIQAIIAATPSTVPIVLDITQAVFNVPINWGKLLQGRDNLYLVGSAVKHGRSTSGLGFLIHPKEGGPLQRPMSSGWCAYLSGLTAGKTVSSTGKLLYDQAFQWFGGTPAGVYSIELFINTWGAILNENITISFMHKYVQQLILQFITALKNAQLDIRVLDMERRQAYANYASNTVVLKVPEKMAASIMAYAQRAKIFFDYRGDSLLRIGFGIQHSQADVEQLVCTLNDIMKKLSSKRAGLFASPTCSSSFTSDKEFETEAPKPPLKLYARL